MNVERITGETCGRPFPVYDNLVPDLLAAHQSDRGERDATVAHVLGTAAGYAYSDIETLSTIMCRLGFEHGGCVRVAQTVDAMQIFSTAYLVQSRCGRVVVVAYRGTEAANLGNWLTDADVGSVSMRLGAELLGVHSGFYRNVRATRWAVMRELQFALEGKSIANPGNTVEYPMRALYVTGHSLGGAMAVLSAILIASNAEQRAIADTLRAVYTFGQPLTAAEPLPEVALSVARKVFRHINAGDIVPLLPPSGWGRFAHLGHEYRFAEGEWMKSDVAVAQLEKLRELPRALLSALAPVKSRGKSVYSAMAHAPHNYISALRPNGRVTEFGDQE